MQRSLFNQSPEVDSFNVKNWVEKVDAKFFKRKKSSGKYE
jgi:hypothetical protein